MRIKEAKGQHPIEEVAALRARVTKLERINRRLIGKSGIDENLDRAWAEREQAEYAIRESEQKFRGIFESANDGIIYVDSAGIILNANERAIQMFGGQRADLLNKSVTELGIFRGAEMRSAASILKEILVRGQAVFAATIKNKQGREMILEYSASLTQMDDQQGNLLVIARDITERKKAEEKERRYIQELELLSESAAAFAQVPIGADLYGYIAGRLRELAPDAIVTVSSYDRTSGALRLRELVGLGSYTQAVIKLMGANPVGKCFEIDDQAREGLSRGELMKVPGGIYDLSPGIPKAVCQAIEKLLGLGDVYGMGLSWKGELLGSIIILTRSRNELSNRNLMETFIRQAAMALQRAEAERALRESEERLEATIDAACLGTWDWNLTTGHIVWAGHHERLFGFAPGEFDGKYKTFESRIHPDDVDGLRQALERSLREHVDYAHEYRVVWPDGTIHWIASRGRYQWDHKNRPTRMLGIASNITDRKRPEEAYRSLVDHSLQGLVIFQNGRVVFANRAMAEITGYTVEEMLAFSTEMILAFVHPEDRQIVWDRHRRRLRGELPPERYELRGIRKDGSIRWLEIDASAVEYQGKPAIQAAYVDITDRKKAMEALRGSEEKHRAIFENAREAIVTFDLKANITNANKLVEEYGFKREELIGQSLFDFVLEDKRAKAIEDFETLIAGHPLRGEMDLITPKGIITVEYSDNPILCAGKVVGAQAILNDITDRKKSEAAIRESEERLKILFESAPDGIYLCDLEGNFIDGNKMAEELTGYTRNELIGRNFAETDLLWPGEIPKAVANLAKIAAGKPAGPDEFILRRKDGTQVAVEIRTYPVRINDQNLSLGIARDITERKKAERLLQKERDKAQKYLDVTAVMMVAVDSEHRVGLINNKGCEVLGYTEEEILGKNWFDNFLPERIRNEVKTVFEKFVTGQKDAPVYFENPILTRDSQERLIAWHNTTIKNEKGDFVAILSSGEDITERRKAEETLKQTETYMRAVLSNAPITIFAIDRQGLFTLSEGKGLERIGLKPGENVGVSALNLYGTTSFTQYDGTVINGKEIFERVLAGETVNAFDELQGISFDNHIGPISGTDGGIIGIVGVAVDITELKRAEEALRQSEERYRDLFENAREAILTFDLNGNITDANKLVEEYGFVRKEFIGKPLLDFVIEAHRPRAVKDFEALVCGRPVRGEMDVVTPKGTMTVEYSDNPIIREGKVTGVQAILTDITERRKTEEALKRQTLLSHVFLESMPCVALLLRPHTREIVAANRQAQEVGAIPGTTCYAAWARRKSACPWCLAPKVWETGKSQHLVVESEGIVWDAYWVPIEEDLYLHYAFDITSRTMAEARLRESEERYRSLFQGSLHPIAIYDREAKIVMLNDIGAENLKKPLGEILGRPLGEFIPETHDLTVKRVQQVLESGRPLFVEDEISLPDGKHWFLSTLHPVAKPKGRPDLVQVISYDITKRKRAEEKLFEYQAKLRAMASEILRAEDRERRRLAIGLHDNICQGLVLTKLAIESSLLLVSNPKVAASLRIAAEAIGETIEETDSLTFELSSPVLREFGLVPALEKYIDEQVRHKHAISCELESDKEISALSDEIKSCLFRVMRELLMNAVRHARANKIRVCIRESQGQLRLSVHDDGIGFKFDEMSSGASKKARFGLFSVREQLEYLGGSLEIDSEPGRGTTVTVIVPLKGKTQD